MKDERPDAVVCFWEWCKTKDSRETWKLVETYGMDQDGYAMTPSVHASKDRHSYNGWMLKYPDDDDSYAEPEPIMGRAVTCWDIESGVSLVRIHPPKWIPFLSCGFYEQIIKKNAWLNLIEGSHELLFGTARAAEDLMFKDEE